MRDNVLITETVRSLFHFSRPQKAYSYCLALQAGAVVVWWPSNTVVFGQSRPLALFAVLLTLGITLSYQCIRLGAEELVFSKQQSLREWLVATQVPIGQLCFGYLVAHLIQILHCLLLSTPIVLTAWSVDGGGWYSLIYCLSIIVLLASAYRTAGICLYLAVGQYGQFTWYILRALLFVGFAVSAVLLPVTNFWKLIDELLLMSYTGRQPDALSGFTLFFVFWMLAFGITTVFLARRIRASTTT